MALLLTEADEFDLPYLVLGGLAGIRSEEQALLTWEENVNWEQEVFDLSAIQTKMSQRRWIPILPVAKEWLLPFKEKTGPILSYAHPDRRPAARLKKHGLRWRRNGLRDAFASYRLAATNDITKVAREMGNSPQVIFNDYLKVLPPRLAEQWWNLTPEAAAAMAARLTAAKVC